MPSIINDPLISDDPDLPNTTMLRFWFSEINVLFIGDKLIDFLLSLPNRVSVGKGVI